jgi:hypothetical protein
MKLTDFYPDQPERRARTVARFWSKVAIGNVGECWEFTGSTAPYGKAEMRYGRFCIVRERPTTAHRAAYLFTHGEVPDDLFVCHACDNPPCCNPTHLFLGTGKDNAADRDRKGRYVLGIKHRGSRNANAKLTEAMVLEIRRRAAAGVSFKALARDYGVCSDSIGEVVRGKTWKHVPLAGGSA